jgi:hypothetical protein
MLGGKGYTVYTVHAVKTGNDVHTTKSRTRVILSSSKRTGAFYVEATGEFSLCTISRFNALLHGTAVKHV